MKMSSAMSMLLGSLVLAASLGAGEWCDTPLDAVQPRVPDKLCRVTLNHHELGGEIDRRIQNLI